MKEERGITLVSLVVTIIILIILAGVSLNLTLGQNGIITKAKQAKENTELAKIEEETALNELYMQMESEGGVTGDISYDAIAKLVEFKREIANYIGEAGGIPPEITADTTTFGNSIKNIVTEVTKDATATAADITTGKTAYVNGNKITGTSSGCGNITFTLVADSGSTGGGWRVARYRFDNSKGIYKKIKCTYWSRNDSLIYVSDNLNETQIYGGVEYDLPQANLITISLVDPSITNTEATFVLYVS